MAELWRRQYLKQWNSPKPVDDDNPVPVQVVAPMDQQSTPTVDHSGLITTGGTAQSLMAENRQRRYLLIQNSGAANIWFNFGITAVTTQPSFLLVPGQAFVQEEGYVSPESISIIGGTTSQVFSAKEA